MEDVDDGSLDCKNLEEEAGKAQALLQECRKRRKELVNEVRNLKKRIKALEIKLPKLTMEIDGCDTTRAELTKLIPELKSHCTLSKVDEAKLKTLQAKVAKCKSDMASCAMLAAKLEAEVARLQKAILDAGGKKLKKQQAACEKALAELDSTDKALKSAKVAITSSEKAVAKARNAKEASENQLDECKELIETKQAEFKALEADAFHVMQAYEKVKAVEEEKRNELEALVKECEELRKSQSEVKCVEIELLGKVDEIKKQLAECENKKQHWENELSKLQAIAEDDDDYDLSDDEEEEPVTSPAADKSQEVVTEGEALSDVEMEDAEQAPPKSPGSKAALPILPPKALDNYDKNRIKEEIGILESERKTIAKNANMGAIAEYRKKEGDYLSR